MYPAGPQATSHRGQCLLWPPASLALSLATDRVGCHQGRPNPHEQRSRPLSSFFSCLRGSVELFGDLQQEGSTSRAIWDSWSRCLSPTHLCRKTGFPYVVNVPSETPELRPHYTVQGRRWDDALWLLFGQQMGTQREGLAWELLVWGLGRPRSAHRSWFIVSRLS